MKIILIGPTRIIGNAVPKEFGERREVAKACGQSVERRLNGQVFRVW